MKIGAANPAGIAGRTEARAIGPPVETPISTIGGPLSFGSFEEFGVVTARILEANLRQREQQQAAMKPCAAEISDSCWE